MFRIVLSCSGVSESAAKLGIADIIDEFTYRPSHNDVQCHWDGARLILQADNDFDSTGQALLEEFSDAVCACLPIEGSAISFAVESVSRIPGSGA